MNEIHSSVREVAVLQESTEMMLSSADLDTVLHQALLIVRNYFGISNCSVFLLDKSGEYLYCRAQNGYDEKIARERRLRVGEDGVTGLAAGRRAPLLVPDVTQEPRYLCGHPAVRSELALPLIVRDELLGVLDIESEKPDYFSESMAALLTLFAGQVAVAVENARLYSTERRRMRQIELINLIARSATSTNEVDQFLGTLAELICDTFEGTAVCILLREPDGVLWLRARSGTAPEPGRERIARSEHAGIIGEALAAHMNVLVGDTSTRPGYEPCQPEARSELCVPLISFGETLGVILVSHAEANFFSADDRAIAQAAADVCATAIKNVALADELRRVTSIDSLTGLYNQRYFHASIAKEIARSRRYHKKFSVAMLDLRKFRAVNAALGYDGGDNVLKRLAQLLRARLRSMDTVCRYAGDRFALVLPETDRESTAVVLEKVRLELASIDLAGDLGKESLAMTTASVGFPQDGEAELDLVRLLLTRLSEAKRQAAAQA